MSIGAAVNGKKWATTPKGPIATAAGDAAQTHSTRLTSRDVTFEAASRDLHDFLILAGTSAATLVGLLFVGLSLHLRVVIAVAEVRSLARFTLANFGAVLFAAMFMVINQDRVSAAFQLIGIALVTMVIVAPSLFSMIRGPQGLATSRSERMRIILRFGVSIAGYVAVGAAGILLLVQQVLPFMILLEATLATLLLVALRNTWDLLVTVGEITLEDDESK